MALLKPPNTQDYCDYLQACYEKGKADASWTNVRYVNYLPGHTLDRATSVTIKATANDSRTVFWTKEMYLAVMLRAVQSNRQNIPDNAGVSLLFLEVLLL